MLRLITQALSPGQSILVNLDPLSPGQLVEYQYNFAISSDTSPSTYTVSLNNTVVFPTLDFGTAGTYQIKGRIGVGPDGTPQTQWSVNDPVPFENTFNGSETVIRGPRFQSGLAEDLSQPSILKFTWTGPKGRGLFVMGVVETK